MKSWKSAVLGVTLLMGFAVPSQAATLTGDNVTVTINDLNGFVASNSGIVGDGTDVAIGLSLYDLNAGANNNEFVVSFDGSFCGLLNCPGTTTIELTDLNFSGGESLIGFTLLSSVFTDVSWVTTATSILFTFADQPGIGVMLTGRFDTGVSAVPVPAALPLLASGLGALGVVGWRRKRKLAQAHA